VIMDDLRRIEGLARCRAVEKATAAMECWPSVFSRASSLLLRRTLIVKLLIGPPANLEASKSTAVRRQ